MRNYRLKTVTLSMLYFQSEGGNYLSLKKCKVYNDGSHFIAIKPVTGKKGVRRLRPPEEVIVVQDGQNLAEKTENMGNIAQNNKKHN